MKTKTNETLKKPLFSGVLQRSSAYTLAYIANGPESVPGGPGGFCKEKRRGSSGGRKARLALAYTLADILKYTIVFNIYNVFP